MCGGMKQGSRWARCSAARFREAPDGMSPSVRSTPDQGIACRRSCSRYGNAHAPRRALFVTHDIDERFYLGHAGDRLPPHRRAASRPTSGSNPRTVSGDYRKVARYIRHCVAQVWIFLRDEVADGAGPGGSVEDNSGLTCRNLDFSAGRGIGGWEVSAAQEVCPRTGRGTSAIMAALVGARSDPPTPQEELIARRPASSSRCSGFCKLGTVAASPRSSREGLVPGVRTSSIHGVLSLCHFPKVAFLRVFMLLFGLGPTALKISINRFLKLFPGLHPPRVTRASAVKQASGLGGPQYGAASVGP